MTTCSTAWAQAQLPALGTAPSARFWVALEQPGPWGAKAFTESRLDPGLGSALEQHCADGGGRFLLVRSPGEHSDDASLRTVLVNGGPADAPWLASGVVQSADDLLRLLTETPDLDVLSAPPAWLQPCPPVLLVCTNGRRDRCCAEFGAPLARALAAEFPGMVWEATHLGGHRFAATALALPSRQVLARVDADLGRAALSGQLLALDDLRDRGRSDLPEALRAADAWLRGQTGETSRTAWQFSLADDLVVAATGQGERRLRVEKVTEAARQLPESCAKPAKPVSHWQVSELPAS